MPMMAEEDWLDAAFWEKDWEGVVVVFVRMV
jgi:hypothetical protein